jgi:16S rRNA (guanine527-N7)-methyltransferase
MTQAALLAAGIAEMGLDVTAEAQQKLLSYLSLLQKWNKVYNLTAVRDPLEMVTLHLLDSLSVLPHIKTKNLLDVGSGGGLPGIVLAICMPQLQVTTIDAV